MKNTEKMLLNAKDLNKTTGGDGTRIFPLITPELPISPYKPLKDSPAGILPSADEAFIID